MKDYIYTVTLTLRAPVVSKGIGGRRTGLDSVCLRDGEDRPALPANLVRGHLREAWRTFSEPDITALPRERLVRWLGRDHTDNKSGAPTETKQRAQLLGRLRFADYWVADNPGDPESLRHRIRIDPDTGAVDTGHLLFIESPYAPGTNVTFRGDIDVVLKDSSEAEDLCCWLEKGFNYLPALGGLKGVGFGKVLKVSVRKRERSLFCKHSTLLPKRHLGYDGHNTLGLGLALMPEGLICFPSPGKKDNRFVSEDHIPGAALKAAMAHRKEKFPILKKHFDALRITHALPVSKEQRERPLALPYSLAFGPKQADGEVGRLYDLALKSSPGLLSHQAPLFQPDWKDKHREVAASRCGWGRLPRRRLLVRNEINSKTGTVRYEEETGGSLYTIEALVPDDHRWLANLFIPDVAEEEEQALLGELAELFSLGLAPLGRTHTKARIEPLEEGIYPLADSCGPPIRDDNQVVIILQSLTLLLGEDFRAMPTNDGEVLLKAYRQTWREFSEGCLDLDWFFARQTLVGGEYWWKRFRRGEKHYRPLVATLPGSVFVCRVKQGSEEKAKRHLERWQRLGLPQPSGIPGGQEWDKNPWIAQNGYGEVAINAHLHWANAPDEETWHALP